MAALFKRIFAIGSVGLAIAMLVWGSFLIRKNSPKTKEVDVRFSPPTQPGSPSMAGEKVNRVSHSDGTQPRFIGGIGLIEPACEAISIGSQVSGIVTEVLVKPGQQVKRGDRLFVIDERASQANLMVAKADLAAQQAKLLELKGQIGPARARLDSAQALVDQSKASRINARQELARAEKVAGAGLSQEEIELRRLSVLLADSRVSEAEANYRDAQGKLDLLDGKNAAPSIMVQQAIVDQAAANVSKAEIELALRTVVAPTDATVLQVKIRVGEFAPAAVLTTPLMILGVTNPLHIRVDIDESEIPRFHESAKAYASVRGRPDIKVEIQFVRSEPYVIPKKTLNGGVSERVDTRVLQIIYSVLPTNIDAITGQQVDVYIEEKMN
jgi:multidrug resistance efflux pump